MTERLPGGADHFAPREGIDRLVGVKPLSSRERRILLPNPPIGQIDPMKIMGANLKQLENIAAVRGLRLNNVELTVPAHLKLPALFKKDRWRSMGSAREIAIAPLWTKEITSVLLSSSLTGVLRWNFLKFLRYRLSQLREE